MEKFTFGQPIVDIDSTDIDISNFDQMYYANCRERELYGQKILTREEYEKVWRQLLLMEMNRNGKV